MTPRERTLSYIGPIAMRHGLTISDIIGKSRRPHIIAARAEAACYLREIGRSYPEIGRNLGGRDHTTIMNLVNGKRRVLKRSAVLSPGIDPLIAKNNARNKSRTAKIQQAIDVRRALGRDPDTDRYKQVAEQFGIGITQVCKMERLGRI